MAKLSGTTKFAYAIGQNASSAKDTLFHYFFLFFFSQVLGVPALWVVVAGLVALFIDALTDPLMGGISDQWQSNRWGRRHLFMLLSAVPLCALLSGLFLPPSFLGMTGLIIWMTAGAVLVRVVLTVFFIPYIALNAELTHDYEERTQLTMLRSLIGNITGIALGMLAYGVFFANTAAFPDGRLNPAGYGKLSLLCGFVAFGSVLISYAGTRREIPRLQVVNMPARVTWLQTYALFTAAFREKAFATLTTGFTAISVMAGVATALSPYIMSYYWGLSQAQFAVVILAMGLAILPGAIIAPWLGRVFDKKNAILVSTALYLVIYLLPFVFSSTGVWDITDTGANYLPVLGFYVTGQVFAISIMILSESMMADVADVHEARTGHRQEGTLFAGIMLARKASFGIGTLISGIILAGTAFPKQKAPGEVAVETLTALGVWFSGAVFLLLLLGFFAFRAYPVTRESHHKLQTHKNMYKDENADTS